MCTYIHTYMQRIKMFRFNCHLRGQLLLKNSNTFVKLLILNLQLKTIASIKDTCGVLRGSQHTLFTENLITNQYLQKWEEQGCFRGAVSINCEAMCVSGKLLRHVLVLVFSSMALFFRPQLPTLVSPKHLESIPALKFWDVIISVVSVTCSLIYSRALLLLTTAQDRWTKIS